jgi:hypothetical protein
MLYYSSKNLISLFFPVSLESTIPIVIKLSMYLLICSKSFCSKPPHSSINLIPLSVNYFATMHADSIDGTATIFTENSLEFILFISPVSLYHGPLNMNPYLIN